MAGLNAAGDALGLEPVKFGRETSYIGVMVDDLVTRGVTEPYRMFTSRAEFRLSLRADNADQRLTPIGINAGCVSERRKSQFLAKMEHIEAGRKLLGSVSITASEAAKSGINISADGAKRDALQLLAFADVNFADVLTLRPELEMVHEDIRLQLKRDALYAQYIERQAKDVEKLKRDEGHIIPSDFDYEALKGLSNELRQKLMLSRPDTLGQAGRVEGITPAALTLILAKLRQSTRKQA
ncbi:unnamed protein product [Ectocarpus sp. 12 AP-2014]